MYDYERMSDCVFCKIVSGEIPSVKIWEDDNFVAILDVFPNTRWMTLVLPKHHFGSDVFDLDESLYTQYLLAVKKVQSFLKKWLWVRRVCMVMEGMWVDHAHIKLYPLHGLDTDWKEYWAKDEVFFDQYAWYISTQLWPKADISELQKVADEIKQAI